MKLKTPAIAVLALALVAPLALLARADSAVPSSAVAGPTADQSTTSKLVYGLLSDSRYAYRPQALDDALSQDIFKRYLEALDGGKQYFTATDIERFGPYKTELDDAIRSGDLAPANVRLAQGGTQIIRRAIVRRVTANQVVVEDRFSGEQRAIEAVAAIDCGFRLPTDTVDAAQLHAGDCVAPRTILEAILEGRRAAVAIDGIGG